MMHDDITHRNAKRISGADCGSREGGNLWLFPLLPGMIPLQLLCARTMWRQVVNCSPSIFQASELVKNPSQQVYQVM